MKTDELNRAKRKHPAAGAVATPDIHMYIMCVHIVHIHTLGTIYMVGCNTVLSQLYLFRIICNLYTLSCRCSRVDTRGNHTTMLIEYVLGKIFNSDSSLLDQISKQLSNAA